MLPQSQVVWRQATGLASATESVRVCCCSGCRQDSKLDGEPLEEEDDEGEETIKEQLGKVIVLLQDLSNRVGDLEKQAAATTDEEDQRMWTGLSTPQHQPTPRASGTPPQGEAAAPGLGATAGAPANPQAEAALPPPPPAGSQQPPLPPAAEAQQQPQPQPQGAHQEEAAPANAGAEATGHTDSAGQHEGKDAAQQQQEQGQPKPAGVLKQLLQKKPPPPLPSSKAGRLIVT